MKTKIKLTLHEDNMIEVYSNADIDKGSALILNAIMQDTNFNIMVAMAIENLEIIMKQEEEENQARLN
jgi:hypothetical protein